MKYAVGIDVGTSGTKVIAVDENSFVAASVVNEYNSYSPSPGFSEQNPEDWWLASKKGLAEITRQIGREHIAVIGLSGQMHGMVALDESLNVVRPAILWNDGRTEKQCAEIISKVGGIDGLTALTNNNMLTGFTAGKILWMKENEPDNYEKTRLIINPKDYIAYKLTGVLSTDVSDASGTGLFDVKNASWCEILIKLCGLNPEFFVKVHRSGEIIGKTSDGIPVIAGGGDAVLSAVSSGLSDSAKVSVMLGTSGVVSKHAEYLPENRGGLLQVSRGCIDNMFHIMGVTLSAAGSYNWLSKVFDNTAFAELDALAEKSPVGAKGIRFLPYLYGERCPVNNAGATGSFTGITFNAEKGDFARAVLEGVAFSLKQVFDVMNDKSADTIILAGGGSKSKLWRRIFADVFNMRVITTDGSGEGSSLGAAIIAGVSVGMFKSVDDAVSKLSVESEDLPCEENVKAYMQCYNEYCALSECFKGR